LYRFPPASLQGPLLLFRIDLHFSHQNTSYCSFLSSMTAAWYHGVYTCLSVQTIVRVVPSGVSIIAPKDEPFSGLNTFRMQCVCVIYINNMCVNILLCLQHYSKMY
jgi:hypothetical protein